MPRLYTTKSIMNFESLKHIYFLGIGGIGMSALARFFASKDVKISGYDRTRTPLCRELEKRQGAKIYYVENIKQIPKSIDLVVYTPAIPQNHAILEHFRKSKIPVLKRSEVLGLITKSMDGICIAGTHGKTTISSLLAHLFMESSVECNAFLGGIAKNYNSNLILSETSNIAVIEADEFDRSFLKLHPQVAVISSIDADHLDVYGDKKALKKSFSEFANLVPENGILFRKYGLPKYNKKCQAFTYHLKNNKADYHLSRLELKKDVYHFDVKTPEGTVRNMKMNYPGLHNVENAIVAIAVALKRGVKESEVRKGLRTFEGVERRFDVHIKTDTLVYIDDYAHHPQEIEACIKSAKELFPNRKITGIFQPHLYSRTRDFADDFAKSLSLLDTVILMDIYAAREKKIEGVTSEMLLSKINKREKKMLNKGTLRNLIRKTEQIEVLLTMGAGDIAQIAVRVIEYWNASNKQNLSSIRNGKRK